LGCGSRLLWPSISGMTVKPVVCCVLAAGLLSVALPLSAQEGVPAGLLAEVGSPLPTGPAPASWRTSAAAPFATNDTGPARRIMPGAGIAAARTLTNMAWPSRSVNRPANARR
jgi:hypothetical protein